MANPVLPSDLTAAIPSVFSNICSRFKSLFLLGPLMRDYWVWAFTSTGEATPAFKALFASIGVPTGGIVGWPVAGSIPEGFLAANGQVVSRAVYPGLYAVLRDTYGNGDGSTTFQLPDYTDSYLVGSSGSVAVGSDVGNATVTLLESNLAPHTHLAVAAAQGVAAYNNIWGSSPSGSKVGKIYPSDDGLAVPPGTAEVPIATTLEKTGSGAAFSILPPSKAVIWLIKT